jgi:hypothetical protein
MYTDKFDLRPEFELEAGTYSGVGTMRHLFLRMIDFLHARHQFELGKDQVEVTNYIFNLRHPELKIESRPNSNRQIIDKRYMEEWEDIFLNITNPVFFSLPRKATTPGSITQPSPKPQTKDGTWEALKWLLSHIGRSLD